MECLRDRETVGIIKYIKRKHSVIKINDEDSICGEVIIKSIRQYRYRNEVDVEFKGQFWHKSYHQKEPKKYEHKDFPGLSKIKVNRMIRKKIISYLNTRLSLFGIEVKHYDSITKFKWVG
jgi:hypothetical protein